MSRENRKGGEYVRNNRKFCEVIFSMLSVVALLMLATRVEAVTSWHEWNEHWRNTELDYLVTLGGPQNVSCSTTLNDISNLGYKFQVSVGLSVYQYHSLFSDFVVNFRTFVCVKSSAPGPLIPFVFAERVNLCIDKDPGSSNPNINRLRFSDADQDPRFFEGNNLTKGRNMPLDFRQALAFGLAVGTTCLSAIDSTGASAIATELLMTGVGSGASSADHTNMESWTDTHAESYWYNPYAFVVNTPVFRQSCLDSEEWLQYQNQEPSTFNGIQIRALITLTNGGRALFGTDYVVTDPIYMKILNRNYFQPGGDGTCPKLFVYNGYDYVDYGVINIHNPTGEDVVKEVSVKPQDVGIDKYVSKIRLQEGWPGLTFSESVIDRVGLYAVDSHGHRYWCPLISARHSRLGNVLPQLLLSDDWKVQTLLLETVDLKFIVPHRDIEGFVFEIEGCNKFKM